MSVINMVNRFDLVVESAEPSHTKPHVDPRLKGNVCNELCIYHIRWTNIFSKRGTPGRGLKVVRAFTNWGRGGARGNQFPTLDAEFKFAKSKIPMSGGGAGGGVVETNFQHLMQSSNLLKSKIPMSSEEGVEGGGGGWWNQLSQLLMLSPNLL